MFLWYFFKFKCSADTANWSGCFVTQKEGNLSLGDSDDTELKDPHTGINLLLVSLLLYTFTSEMKMTWEQVKFLHVSVCRGLLV